MILPPLCFIVDGEFRVMDVTFLPSFKLKSHISAQLITVLFIHFLSLLAKFKQDFLLVYFYNGQIDLFVWAADSFDANRSFHPCLVYKDTQAKLYNLPCFNGLHVLPLPFLMCYSAFKRLFVQ